MIPRKALELSTRSIVLLAFWISQTICQDEGSENSVAYTPQFNPVVTALCRAGVMTITVRSEEPFFGVVHSRDYRKPGCLTDGIGSFNTTLKIDLLAEYGSPNYCGVNVDEKTEQRSVPIAVRAHRTLELADDKYYVITCGKSGYKNSRNQTSEASLMLMQNGRKTSEVVYGRPYTLRADVSNHDGSYGIAVKNCFSFSGENNTVVLIDEYGCPADKSIISAFAFNATAGKADATIYSMFKFPKSNKAHFQCDIVLCKGTCRNSCDLNTQATGRSLTQQRSDEEDGVLMAATSVFVVEPGDEIYLASAGGLSCQTFWMYLAITFGILLLIMLLVNIFLCSSVNGSCTKTEIIEKEPSIIDDYDPYKVHWSGSQYGSRYALNGRPRSHHSSGGHPAPAYGSGASTMNSSRSYSTTNSDHYAIVHSRPGSRPESRYSQKRHRSGPSMNGGHHHHSDYGNRAGHEVY